MKKWNLETMTLLWHSLLVTWLNEYQVRATRHQLYLPGEELSQMDRSIFQQSLFHVGRKDVYVSSILTMGRGSKKENELHLSLAGSGLKNGLGL